MHKEGQAQFEDFLGTVAVNMIPDAGSVLDIGSFNVNGAYKPHIERRGWDYYGVDIRGGPNVDQVVPDDCFWDLGRKFDMVICGQTLEHSKYPWRLVSTAGMHLKPGGLMYIAAPWRWPDHDHPHDLYRFHKHALEWMMRDMARCTPMGGVMLRCIPNPAKYIDSVVWGTRDAD